MKSQKILLGLIIGLFVLSVLPGISAFVINARLIETELSDGTSNATYVTRHRADSHVLVDPASGNTLTINLRKELGNNLTDSDFQAIFGLYHDEPYVFKLNAIEPTSYKFENNQQLAHECSDRCDWRDPTESNSQRDTGAKAELLVKTGDGDFLGANFKADIDNPKFDDFVQKGDIKFAIKDIKVADFYETYIGDDRYYFPVPNSKDVSVEFCVVFKYKPLNGGAKLPDPHDEAREQSDGKNCFFDVKEMYVALATEISLNVDESLENEQGVVAAGAGLAGVSCEQSWNSPTEFLEVRGRPKANNVAQNIRGNRFNMFAQDEMEEKTGGGFTIDMTGITAEDTGEQIYTGEYSFELISFSPKIVYSEGDQFVAVERDGVPDALIKVTEHNTNTVKDKIRMDYHAGNVIERTFPFGDRQLILRLYEPVTDIHMPYFLSTNADNLCKNTDRACSFNQVENDCWDAHIRFAMKTRLFKDSKKYSWFMKTKREVQRLAEGPNLSFTVNSVSGKVLGVATNTKVTVSFTDPVTGEEYSLQKNVSGNQVVTFNAPISIVDSNPVSYTVEAVGYQTVQESITINSEPFSKEVVVRMTPDGEIVAITDEEEVVSAKFAVFSYDAFITLLDSFVPYYTDESYQEIDSGLMSYLSEDYKAIYNAIKEYRIFKIVDPATRQELNYEIDNSFTGSITDDGYEIPLTAVLRFDTVTLNKPYKAYYFLPDTTVLGAGETVSNASQLKVIEVTWTFTQNSLIEANWFTREQVEEGEW